MADKGWQRAFEEPISLSGGGKLVTLHDAATYATGLSKENAATAGWKTATSSACSIRIARTIIGKSGS
jgi:hypothetical protein